MCEAYVFAAAAEGDGTPNKTGWNETDFEQSAVMPAGSVCPTRGGMDMDMASGSAGNESGC